MEYMLFMANYVFKITQQDLIAVLKLAIPLMLTGLVGACIGFFETVFLAQLGYETMAAGALVSWLFGVFVVIIFGILSAVNILISRKHGANDVHGISLVIRDGLLLSILLSIPAIFLFWNMAPVFLIFGQSPAIVLLTESYLHALVWGLLPTLIVVTLTELLIGLGHTRQVMFITILSVFFTLVFSFLLIFGVGPVSSLGIAGAGWGISINYWIMAMIITIYFWINPNYRIYFSHAWKMTAPFYLYELFELGLPMGVMYCIEAGYFFALTLLAGSISTQLLAANQIALQYMGTLMTVIFSIAQAVTVRMGHLIGSKEIETAKQVKNIGIVLSFVFMSIWALIYWLFPSFLISIDLDIHNYDNIEIVRLTKQLFIVSAVFQLFEATRISIFGALRALKDTYFALISSIISFWGIALPFGYLFATQFHMSGPGLWWGMTIGSGFGMLLLWWRFDSISFSFKIKQ